MPIECALPAELTIYTISEWAPQCLAWLDAGAGEEDDENTLRVDAQAVAEVDAAGVQLLLSLANTLQARHRELWLESPSEPLRAACHTLGAAGLMRHASLKGPVL